MSKRVTFAEFNELLKNRQMSAELLVNYVNFDEQSAIPRLVFRSDALVDRPPDDYDVDDAIYRYERELRRQSYELQDVLLTKPRIDVVAEGDSWFNLPMIIRPP